MHFVNRWVILEIKAAADNFKKKIQTFVNVEEFICCSLTHIGPAMLWTFFCSGVGKTNYSPYGGQLSNNWKQKEVGWLISLSRLHSDDSLDTCHSFGFWITDGLRLGIVEKSWQGSGVCPCLFILQNDFGSHGLQKNKKQRIVASVLLRFFYEAGRNLDGFFLSCLLKGSVCLDERDYLVCGWCVSGLGGRLCYASDIQLIVSEKHASSLIRNKKLRRLN